MQALVDAFIAAPSITTLAACFDIDAVYLALYGLLGAGITWSVLAFAYRKIRGAVGGGRARL